MAPRRAGKEELSEECVSNDNPSRSAADFKCTLGKVQYLEVNLQHFHTLRAIPVEDEAAQRVDMLPELFHDLIKLLELVACCTVAGLQTSQYGLQGLLHHDSLQVGLYVTAPLPKV